jgi:membrane fusion protein, multidrug efflux system
VECSSLGSRFDRKYPILFVICSLLLLVICSLLLLTVGCSKSGTAEASAAGGAAQGKGGAASGGRGARGDAAVSVIVAKASARNVPIQAEVIGNVEASSTVTLRPQISGQLVQAHFQEGQFVNKGQLLLSVDRSVLDAQLRQLESQIRRDEAAVGQATANLARDRAQEANARAQLERANKLLKEGILSKEQYDQYSTALATLEATVTADEAAVENSKATIETSRAAIATQKVQVGFTNIYAPISGRTGTLLIKPGNIVTANQTDLATINQVQPVYVTFALPEANLAILRQHSGPKMQVTAIADEGGAKETGALAFFENAVDQTTGTIKLKATFPNTNRTLWPGQFVRVTLRLGEKVNAVLVPNQAVQSGQEGTFVYIVKPDQRVDIRNVVAGQRIGEETVIEKGVEPGETVVTEGTLRLVPGARVQVREPQGPSGPGGGRRKTGGKSS